jgi:putative transposase
MLAHRESGALAKRLIKESCAKQGIVPGELTLHADRGSSMRSKPVALMLADLGVTKTQFATTPLERQPLLRVSVQDAEILPTVPATIFQYYDAGNHFSAFSAAGRAVLAHISVTWAYSGFVDKLTTHFGWP